MSEPPKKLSKMSVKFFEKLQKRVDSSKSLLCIGLDPHVSQLTEATAASAEAFCLKIIKETHPYAAAFKPNSAFFEAFGPEGFETLSRVIKAIPDDIPVILDSKRGDIDTTAQAYATSSYDIFNASAVTLSPYMGWDSVQPFVAGQYQDKGAFILCKTSNKSSKDFQELKLMNGDEMYQSVAKLCNAWNLNTIETNSAPCVGVVAGATDIHALRVVRETAPDIWILCPGVGAQGGDAETVCSVGLRKSDGYGLLVSVSRGISKAVNMAQAAEVLRDEITVCRNKFMENHTNAIKSTEEALMPYQKEFIEFAVGENVLQFSEKGFKLKSGRMSPYFFNAGLFCNGRSVNALSRFYAMAIKESGVEFDVIFGPAYKGIPLATTLALAWFQLYGESKDITYNRKEVKDHGEGGQLVGASMKGRKVLVVDDVITAGTAIRESVEILNAAGATLVAVAVSLDRQEKATNASTESAIQQVEKDLKIPVLSIVRLKHLVSYISGLENTDKNLLNSIVDYRSKYGVEFDLIFYRLLFYY